MARRCGFSVLFFLAPGPWSGEIWRSAVDVPEELVVDRLGQGHVLLAELGKEKDIPKRPPAALVVVADAAARGTLGNP